MGCLALALAAAAPSVAAAAEECRHVILANDSSAAACLARRWGLNAARCSGLEWIATFQRMGVAIFD